MPIAQYASVPSIFLPLCSDMRLTIFSRLMLGYLILLLLAAGVGMYSILQLGLVKEITHSIILVDNAILDRYKDMTDALLSEARYEKRFAIMQDNALYESFLASRDDFEKFLEEAKAFADSTAVQDALAKLEDRHRTYQTLFEEEVAFLRAGSSYPKEQYGREKERMVSEALEELSRLRTLSQQSILHKIRSLDEAGTRARTVDMAITGTALLLGIVLSVSITRSITVPLSRMKKKTGEIANGIFEADLDLPSPPEIGALAQDFNIMCAKLKEVDRMKSDFYSHMSHELRTPLTSIREGTNMFLEGLGGEVTEKQRELLTIVAEESTRLIELINPLLDLSRLEAGMVAFHFARTDLAALVARSVREVAPLAEAKTISIETDLGESPELSVDAERILLVLRNLIGNALKFTPPGGSVCVRVRRAEDGVQVSVTDTGAGIAREEINTIFEKFRQASHANASGFQGSGLGLATVKHIVNAHGGKVWVESEVGRGSTFTFVLSV
jgi:two-component system, NtrC family, sensor histidine kinase GlrK